MYEGCEIDERVKNGVKSVLAQRGYIIKNGKIRQVASNFSTPPNGPWIFIRGMDNRKCGLWALYHDHFKFLPHYCANHCWKVVVRVMAVRDLYKLYDVAMALNFPGKVGINRRDWVKGPYLGFFYFKTKEDAKKHYDIIKEALIPYIENFDIIYKQKCTEMEINGHPEDPILEEKCDCMFEPIEDSNRTSAWLKSLVMDEWERFAFMIGDETATYRGYELKTYEAHQQRSENREHQCLQCPMHDMSKGQVQKTEDNDADVAL